MRGESIPNQVTGSLPPAPCSDPNRPYFDLVWASFYANFIMLSPGGDPNLRRLVVPVLVWSDVYSTVCVVFMVSCNFRNP